MALVQALPVTVTDHPNPGLDVQQCRPLSSHSPSGPGPCGPCTSGTTMGSVSSLISGRTYQEKHCRAASEFTARARRSTPATSCFRLQDNTLRSGSSLEQLLVASNQTHPQAQVVPPPLPTKKQPRPGNSAGASGGAVAGAAGGGTNGNFGLAGAEVVVGDWNDNLVVTTTSPCSDSEEQRDNRTLNGNIGGPPPKLIPVSGQLEKVRAVERRLGMMNGRVVNCRFFAASVQTYSLLCKFLFQADFTSFLLFNDMIILKKQALKTLSISQILLL